MQMKCDNCIKEYERNTFCSGACKTAYHNKGPKKISVAKIDYMNLPIVPPKHVVIADLSKEHETPLQVEALTNAIVESAIKGLSPNTKITINNPTGGKKTFKNGCKLHGKKFCMTCKNGTK